MRNEMLPVIEVQQSTHVDAEASLFVSAMGSRLVYASPNASVFQCRFILYDDTVGVRVPGFVSVKQTHQVNALPGGIVLVPLSLFSVTDDEAEFATALARAVAHVALRHWMRTMVRAEYSSPWKPFLPTLLFSRSLEKDADHAAVEILSQSGLNPEAVARYVKNARASFDTSDARLETIRKQIAELPQRVYGPDQTLQFNALKARLSETRIRL
jgi:predicted Zn-dependent protease